MFVNFIKIYGFREYINDDGVIGIGLWDNWFGREMTEIRVYKEFGVIGVETKGGERERAKCVRLIGDFVVSAKKKMKNAPLIPHCCCEE